MRGTLQYDGQNGRSMMRLIRPLPKQAYIGYLRQSIDLPPRTHRMVECVFQKDGMLVGETKTVLAVSAYSADDGVMVHC